MPQNAKFSFAAPFQVTVGPVTLICSHIPAATLSI
jgi:hypothetical protein